MIIEKIKQVVIIVLLLTFPIFPAPADTITLKDGSTLEGAIGAEDDETVLISVPVRGLLKVPRSSIQSIEKGTAETGLAGKQPNEVDEFRFLDGRDYLDQVRQSLRSAKRSIRVMMYFSYRTDKSTNPANIFLKELAEASRRGVEVKVILETSHEEIVNEGNRASADWLLDQGIEAMFFPTFPVMHVKLVLIDDEISIVGSHNWTSAAIYYNVESSVLVRCPRVAKAYRDYFERAYLRCAPYREIKAKEKREKKS